MERASLAGRGAGFNPPNRFEEISVGRAPEDIAHYFEDPDPERTILTKFYFDHTKSILAKNESPDLGFTYSINPYRGCEHGCIYCYARPSHEYLGFSSGIDFESKILVKEDAPRLLRETFLSRSWIPQVVLFSGETDCYQPVERRLGITRECLGVFLKFRNPVSVITKNALIQRDVDILKELAAMNVVSVIISITTLDERLARTMEPRTSTPLRRLETVRVLSDNGIPVSVNIAPLIPGLNDEEIPEIIRRVAHHGATRVNYSLLRLPYAVKDLFLDWLRRELPEKASRIENRIRSVRSGKLSTSEFGKRMSGEG
ncbi:MAG TPA: PA0069 family radical SAM protein, partial [Bacteroidota bacterium]